MTYRYGVNVHVLLNLDCSSDLSKLCNVLQSVFIEVTTERSETRQDV